MKIKSEFIEKLDETRFILKKNYKPQMNVDGIIYSNDRMIEDVLKEQAIEQLANMAGLPGVVSPVLAMPDVHWGYGFPIGGVAATDIDENGVISPGGVGFDINCGVRLIKTPFCYNQIREKIPKILETIYHNIPAGVGSNGILDLNKKDRKNVLIKGAKWVVEQGYGFSEDLDFTEENGCMPNSDPEDVSEYALDRSRQQLGTLGSGNHFIEIQKVNQIYNSEIAQRFGIFKNQIVIMIHSGSRGLGHQICTDHLKAILKSAKKFNFIFPDRQLAYAPVKSAEGKAYLSAMRCAANYAWANRQMLMYLVRKSIDIVLKVGGGLEKYQLLYDVAHNIAKIEQYVVDGVLKNLCVHRKGATRAFGPQCIGIPELMKDVGQPVIIPGDMGTSSFLLVGTEKAMKDSFGSTCHGAGRVLSRTKALKTLKPSEIIDQMKKKGISVMAADKRIIAEEASQAYKDIEQIIDIVDNAEISKKVCKLKPIGVIKG